MKDWDILKDDIKKCNSLSENNSNWRYRYLRIKNDFENIPIPELKEIANNDVDNRVIDIANNRIDILKNYTIRKDFNNVVTVKLIMPVGCNAKCGFCYNNDYSVSNTKDLFVANIDTSIEKIVNSIAPHFPISLDITGGEPTLDIKLFKTVLNKLKLHPLIGKFCRITLNTNGLNLQKALPEIEGIIDYVNIPTHFYNEQKRNNVFKTYRPTTKDYKVIVLSLLNIGIDTSTICVIHEEITDFETFNSEYIKWCKSIGFVSLRYRNDSFKNEIYFETYMNHVINLKETHLIQLEKSNDSTWCRISDNEGFYIFFLNGVLDTSKVSKGIEYIIHDDGLLYTDYLKTTKFTDYDLPVDYILDTKPLMAAIADKEGGKKN